MSRTKLTLLHGANHDLLAYVGGSKACLHKLTTAMVGIFPQVPSINTTLYSQGSINILSKSTSCFLITATKYLTLSNWREGSLFWFIVQGIRFIMARWAWRQACEAVGHLTPTVRMKREMNVGTEIIFSLFLFYSVRGYSFQYMGWYHPYTFRGKLPSQTYPDVCLCNLLAWSVKRVACPFKR